MRLGTIYSNWLTEVEISLQCRLNWQFLPYILLKAEIPFKKKKKITFGKIELLFRAYL